MKNIKKELNIRIIHPTIKQYIPTISEALHLPAYIKDFALEFIDFQLKQKEQLFNKRFTGVDSRGVAAAIIYLICYKVNYKISQAEIEKAAHISILTLRKRIKEIRVFLTGFHVKKEI